MIDTNKRAHRTRKENMSLMRANKIFFNQVPQRLTEDLYQLYKIDFDLLGYEYPQHYINMGYGEREGENM